MKTGDLYKQNESAYTAPISVSYSAIQAATGLSLKDNQKITITEALNTCNIASAESEGIISFIAGNDTLFIFNDSQLGWVGDTPTFKVGYTYNVVYYDGGFYADQGRLVP